MATIPQRTLQRPLYGLLPALAGANPALPDHWEDGLEWMPERPIPGGVAGVVACELAGFEIGDDQPPGVTYRPFVIWAADRCSRIASNRDRRGRAQRNLDAVASFLVEGEFWNGSLARGDDTDAPEDYGNNLFLAANGAEVVGDGPLAPQAALACLDEAFAAFAPGQRAYIHVTVGMADALKGPGSLERNGNLLMTAVQSIVVPGAGYTGDGPATAPGGDPVAAADGSVWAYATVAPEVRLGPVTFLEDFDRTVNTETVWASQVAAVTVDPYARLAVEIDLPHCTAGP